MQYDVCRDAVFDKHGSKLSGMDEGEAYGGVCDAFKWNGINSDSDRVPGCTT